MTCITFVECNIVKSGFNFLKTSKIHLGSFNYKVNYFHHQNFIAVVIIMKRSEDEKNLFKWKPQNNVLIFKIFFFINEEHFNQKPASMFLLEISSFISSNYCSAVDLSLSLFLSFSMCLHQCRRVMRRYITCCEPTNNNNNMNNIKVFPFLIYK